MFQHPPMARKLQYLRLPIIIMVCCLSVRSAVSPSQRNGPTSGSESGIPQQLSALQRGAIIEREIATGQAHAYGIALASDRFLKIVVYQQGALIDLILRGPRGELVAGFSPCVRGVETLYAICRDAGQYKLEVTCPSDGMKEPGRYRLVVSELRDVTPDEDRSLLLAQQKYMEGHALAQDPRKRHELTTALAEKYAPKYTDAYHLFNAVGDPIGASNALCAKAEIYSSANEHAEALSNFQGALDVLRQNETKFSRSEADLNEHVALAWQRLGGWQQALYSLEEAARLYDGLSDATAKAKVLKRIAFIYKYSIPKGERKAANYFQQAIKELGAGDKIFAQELRVLLEESNRVITAIDTIDRARLVYFGQMGPVQQRLVAKAIRSLEGISIEDELETALYATLLNTTGLGYEILGDKSRAFGKYIQALRLCDQLGDPEGTEARRFAVDHIIKLNPSYNDPLGWIKSNQPELMFQVGHTGSVEAVAISPDGSLIASAGDDGMVKLWDAHSDRLIHTLNQRPDRLKTGIELAFSLDGKLLVVESAESRLKVWLVASGRTLLHLSEGDNLALSPDGRFLVVYPEYRTPIWRSKEQGTTVTLWDRESGRPIGRLPGHLGGVARIGFSRDGDLLACDCGDRVVRVWQIGSGKPFESLAPECHDHNAKLDVEWESGLSSDSTTADGALTVEAEGRDITLRDNTTNKLIRVYKGAPYKKTGTDWREKVPGDPASYYPEVSLGLDQGTLSWSDNTRIRIWDLQMGTLIRSYAPPGCEAIKLSPNGSIALVGSRDGVRVQRPLDGKVIRFFKGIRLRLDQSLSKDGRLLISREGDLAGTGRGEPEILNTRTGRLRRLPEGSHYELSNDGKTMTVLDFRTFGLYQKDFRTGKRVFGPKYVELGNDVVGDVHLSPNRRRLAVFQGGNQAGSYELIETRTGQHIGSLSGGAMYMTPLVFAPDNRIVAVVNDGIPIDLWDAETGKLLNTLPGHSDGTTALRFALGGKILISASIDGSIRFWAPETGDLLATLLVLEDDDWIITTPDGLFDGPVDAMRKVNWRVGNTNEVVPLDAFFNDFYYPGLLAEIMEGKRPKPTIDIVTALQLPSFRLMLAQRMASIEKRGAKTFLCFRDKPTVVPRVFSDAQPHAFDVNDLTFEEEDRVCPYRKELSDNQQYEIVNASRRLDYKMFKPSYDGTKSETRRSTLHIQTVGISSYEYERSGLKPLPSSASGAREVERLFNEQQNSTSKPYRDIRVWKGLYDKEATRDGISKRLAQITKDVKEDDVVLLFLSGHGMVPAGQEMFYFAPFDMRGPSPQDQRESGLNTAMIAEVVRKMPARRVVLIIDACQSGGALESLAKIAEVKAKVEQRRARVERKEKGRGNAHEVGVYLIAAATPLQEAVQPKIGNGALVQTLLEGLKSEGRRRRTGVWMRDLVKHIKQHLPQISAEIGQRHTPMVVETGLDFPITGRGADAWHKRRAAASLASNR